MNSETVQLFQIERIVRTENVLLLYFVSLTAHIFSHTFIHSATCSHFRAAQYSQSCVVVVVDGHFAASLHQQLEGLSALLKDSSVIDDGCESVIHLPSVGRSGKSLPVTFLIRSEYRSRNQAV